MNTKMSKMGETVKTKSLGNSQQTSKTHDIEHKHVTMIPPKEVLLLCQDDIVEVTVKKTKAQKRTSPVASISSGQKTEKKRSTTDNESPPNWGNIFRQQNLLHIKEQSSKHNKNKEIKKNVNDKKQQKTTIKHPIKSEEKHLKTPGCSSRSILVQDKAVQCEIYNSDKLAEFNPTHVTFNKLHMLYLIKQLQDVVNKKDKKTCEIFTEMEQILQKIPDVETKAESNGVLFNGTALESNKKMKTVLYESFILEREKLQSEILKRDEQLKEVDQKHSELTKMLTQQLDEVTHEKNDIMLVVADLKREIESKRIINERIITDLKTDLNKQTELAYKNYIDNKYLTMEMDKISALSSYKDTQIIDYRNTVKELQNQIEKQLRTINEICMKEGTTSPQISLIHTGHACSSPTSSFSNDSNKSLHDLSDISSVDSMVGLEEHVPKKDQDFELVSLLDGESSHTIMLEVTNDKKSTMQNNENNIVSYHNVDTNDVKKSLRHSSKKDHNKENDTHKTKKFIKLKEKQIDNAKNLFLASKALESITSTKSTVSGRKQGDMQNRKPVNVPSPLRDYPHPDWSDSSLPSISSTVSNLDIVPLNDV